VVKAIGALVVRTGARVCEGARVRRTLLFETVATATRTNLFTVGRVEDWRGDS